MKKNNFTSLSTIVQTGDLLFASGDSIISTLIKKFTFGETNHVGLVYDRHNIFETDIKWGKAQLHPIDRYNDKKVLIVRPMFLEDHRAVQKLCEKYDKTPYSYIDIVTNAIFAPLHDELRKRMVRLIGTKKFAICSELTAKIIHEASGYQPFSKYEGLTPQDILMITRLGSDHWKVLVDRFSE